MTRTSLRLTMSLLASSCILLVFTTNYRRADAAPSVSFYAQTYLPLLWNYMSSDELTPQTTRPAPTVSTSSTATVTESPTPTTVSSDATATSEVTAQPLSSPTALDPVLPTVPTPPLAELIVGDRRQESGVATFCWREYGCTDYRYVATPKTELVVMSQFEAVFNLKPEPLPTWVHLMIMKVTPADEVFIGNSPFRWWRGTTPVARRDLDLSHQPSTNVHLSPGLYVFNLWVYWERPGENLGDAHYGFLVRVETLSQSRHSMCNFIDPSTRSRRMIANSSGTE